LRLGAENLDSLKGKTDKRPMFSEQALRDLAEMTAQELLKREDAENFDLIGYVETIERFSPSRGIQLRQKFDLKKKNSTATAGAIPAPTPPGRPMPVKTEPESQKQLDENLQNFNGKKLSDEERKKVVDQSRKIIAETPNREQKIMALTGLAIQIAKIGDKELAIELMNDVRSLITLQPKNYRDYMEIWMLSSGYALIDAEKAFPILEDTIYRINDTISAFVKVGEFMDVSGEMIDDGEIQVGSFGGEISRDLLRNMGSSDATVRNLAVSDFARTKALSEKFDRQEVRILAKMLILRAVLAKEKESSEKDDF
jgi:hypothetical protein